MGPAELREKWARSWAKTSGSHQVPLRKAVLHRLCQLCIGVLWGRDGVPCRERGERARPWLLKDGLQKSPGIARCYRRVTRTDWFL